MMVNRLCIPPLLQVPPASRGEPFGSFAPLRGVLPASRGEPLGSFVPLPQAPPTSQGEPSVGSGSPCQQGAPKGGGLPKLHEACQQFEAVFLLQLWRAMQRTIPRERQTLNYAEMFDLTFAEYLARYGQFGIAEKLYEQLTRGGQTP
jgi:hypothetical protein